MAVMTGLVLAVTGALSVDVPQGTDAAEKAEEISHGEAQIRQELTDKRTKFTKQYILS